MGVKYPDLPFGLELSAEVQPITLLYNIFDRKGAPFVYLPLKNGTTFTHLLKNTASLFLTLGIQLLNDRGEMYYRKRR